MKRIEVQKGSMKFQLVIDRVGSAMTCSVSWQYLHIRY